MILQSRKQQKIILYLRDIHEGAEILGRQMLQDQINGYPHVPLPHHPDKINLEEIRNISDSVADPGDRGSRIFSDSVADPGDRGSRIFSIPDPNFFHPGSQISI